MRGGFDWYTGKPLLVDVTMPPIHFDQSPASTLSWAPVSLFVSYSNLTVTSHILTRQLDISKEG